jgi:hypothetical protein
MWFLASGEGPSDIGRCKQYDPCCDGDFVPGPMGLLADQVIEGRCEISAISQGMMYALSKRALKKHSKYPRAMRLRGRKRPAETVYYFHNACVLAQHAKVLEVEQGQKVVAILFRDADGTHSAGRGERDAKVQSMLDGFAFEGFVRGVPMVPKPKSEAWLLCALKQKEPYRHCGSLEDASGNDASPQSLKKQLASALGYAESVVPAADLADLVSDRRVDAMKLSMPSFVEFRERLEQVIDQERANS